MYEYGVTMSIPGVHHKVSYIVSIPSLSVTALPAQ